MFKELFERLVERGHKVLLIARDKVQAVDLYREEGLDPIIVGQYAKTLEGKLIESSKRIYKMTDVILRELKGLDAIVSNTGVEASRVGFGLGASVHTFHDHPEAIHQMLLTIPISTYVYYPWVIPEDLYLKLGLSIENLVPYKGFLSMAWMPKIKVDEEIITKLGLVLDRKLVVFRESELGAAYLFGRGEITLQAVKELAMKEKRTQFVARPRYSSSILESYFKGIENVTIFRSPIDLQSLLAKASLLIGGGATMCLESTYFGTPTILTRQITAPITDYLNKVGLATKAHSVDEVISLSKKVIRKRNEKLAKKIYGEMEFPLDRLIANIEE